MRDNGVLFDYCDWRGLRFFFPYYHRIFFLFAWKCWQDYFIRKLLRVKVDPGSKLHPVQLNYHIFYLQMTAFFSVKQILRHVRSLARFSLLSIAIQANLLIFTNPLFCSQKMLPSKLDELFPPYLILSITIVWISTRAIPFLKDGQRLIRLLI